MYSEDSFVVNALETVMYLVENTLLTLIFLEIMKQNAS